MTRIPTGTTDQYLYFVARDAADFTTRKTGLTAFAVYRSRNGGAATQMTTPTVAELSAANMTGIYSLLLDEDMTIDAGDDEQAMVFHITCSGMDPVTLPVDLFRPKVTAGAALSVDANGMINGTVEGTFDFLEAMRLIMATLFGKVSGAGTTTITIRDASDSKDRIIVTVDASGNRSAFGTLDGA